MESAECSACRRAGEGARGDAREARPERPCPEALFAIEGGLLVAQKERIGRIAGDKIEWIDSVPAMRSFGATKVWNLGGRWPNAVNVLCVNVQSRADEPTYCTTPFVYLYDVSEQNDSKFTFPATRRHSPRSPRSRRCAS